MARTDDRPHDPFAPPVPAFPVNRLRAAGLNDARLGHLDRRFDEMSTTAARQFVNRVRTHPTREVAALFEAPEGYDIDALAQQSRDRLVWLAASYGRPISGNRHELANEVVWGRDIDEASSALVATVDATTYPDPDDYRAAVDAAVPNRADDESDEDYLTRLHEALPRVPDPVEETATDSGQDGAQEPDSPPVGTDAPPAAPEAPTGEQEPTGTAPTEDPQETSAADPQTPAAPEGTDDGVVTEPPASDTGTIDQVTDTPSTEIPGDTPQAVEGDTATPVDGDSPVAVDGDTVTAVTGDASPEVSASMTADAAPKRAGRRAGK